MGKNTWPDWDELIQKAVNAGRIQGAAMAKDTYQATERRLYALPILREKLQEDKEKLEEIAHTARPSTARALSDTPAPASGFRRKKSWMESSRTWKPPLLRTSTR